VISAVGAEIRHEGGLQPFAASTAAMRRLRTLQSHADGPDRILPTGTTAEMPFRQTSHWCVAQHFEKQIVEVRELADIRRALVFSRYQKPTFPNTSCLQDQLPVYDFPADCAVAGEETCRQTTAMSGDLIIRVELRFTAPARSKCRRCWCRPIFPWLVTAHFPLRQ